MAEPQRNGSVTRVLGQALAVAALMAAFTGLFLPVKRYADRQDEMDRELTELRAALADIDRKLAVIETKLDLLGK